MSENPEYGFGYYRRGWFKGLIGDLNGAIEDLSMSIVLDPENSFAYQTRADVFVKQEKKDLAELDYKKVIEIEDSPEKYHNIPYAYQGLGEYKKAKETLDIIIAKDTADSGNYYDAACLYSRMRDKEGALGYLQKAFEKGYNRFAHIERDDDLDFIRDTDEFKVLIKKYLEKDVRNNNSTEIGHIGANNTTTEVKFEKENGVCKVKCKINDLPLHFIFDTGASDVTLSMVEATFMMKNGYLNERDVVGKQRYMDANGNVNVGKVINLREVEFGGHSLKNVRASVVRTKRLHCFLDRACWVDLVKLKLTMAEAY